MHNGRQNISMKAPNSLRHSLSDWLRRMRPKRVSLVEKPMLHVSLLGKKKERKKNDKNTRSTFLSSLLKWMAGKGLRHNEEHATVGWDCLLHFLLFASKTYRLLFLEPHVWMVGAFLYKEIIVLVFVSRSFPLKYVSRISQTITVRIIINIKSQSHKTN